MTETVRLSDDRLHEIITLAGKRTPVPDFDFQEFHSMAAELRALRRVRDAAREVWEFPRGWEDDDHHANALNTLNAALDAAKEAT